MFLTRPIILSLVKLTYIPYNWTHSQGNSIIKLWWQQASIRVHYNITKENNYQWTLIKSTRGITKKITITLLNLLNPTRIMTNIKHHMAWTKHIFIIETNHHIVSSLCNIIIYIIISLFIPKNILLRSS